jgi:hypothetical protein
VNHVARCCNKYSTKTLETESFLKEIERTRGFIYLDWRKGQKAEKGGFEDLNIIIDS